MVFATIDNEHIGIPGLHEDIGPFNPFGNQFSETTSEFEHREKVLIDAREFWFGDSENRQEKHKPIEVYRKYGTKIRDVILETDDRLQKIRAKWLLEDLLISVTVPMNEMETPYFIDSYTGEVISDDPEEKESFWKDSGAGEVAKPLPTTDNELSKSILWAYERIGRPDMAGFAIAATYGGFDTEEEDLQEEDRGYQPEHAEMWNDGNPLEGTSTLHKAAKKCAEWRFHEHNPAERNKIYWKALGMVSAIARNVSVQDAVLAFIIMHDEGILKPADAKSIKVASGYGSFVTALQKCANQVTDWLIDHEDNQYQLSLQANKGEIQQSEIETQLRSLYPKSSEPTQTYAFLDAYAAAMVAGAKPAEAANFAYDAYRASISKAGQRAFENTQGSIPKKWGAFYQAARKAGDITETVVTVKRTGLVLKPNIGRELKVGWRWIPERLHSMSHNKEDFERLLGYLTDGVHAPDFVINAVKAHISTL